MSDLINKIVEIKKSQLNDQPVWEVHCHRVTMGKTPDKHIYLDFTTLDFVGYME